MERSSRSSTLAILGFAIGVAAMALVASVPGSPFQPVLPGGVEPGGPVRWLAEAVGIGSLGGAGIVAAGVTSEILAVGAFLLVLREAWRGAVTLRTVVIMAVAANLLVLVLPLLYSRDVYSYIAYGNIAGLHQANPYVQTPADYPRDAVATLVGPKWFSTPAVYGPLFTGYASIVVRAVRGIGAQVEAFRLTAVTAGIATLSVIATTVRRLRPARAAFAVAAFGLNPAVIFQSVASGHNDLLVALAVAGAFALVLAGRHLLAVAALTLGTLVKATAALPLLLLVVWCVARAPAGRRLRTFATHAGLAAAIGAGFAAPFFQLRDPTLGMLELAGHEGWLAPSRLLRRLLDAISGDALGVVARVAFAALLVVAIWMLARAVWRSADRPAEDHPAGDHPAGDHPAGDHPAGDHPAGDHPAGDHPAGDHPAGDHASADHPAGDGAVLHIGAAWGWSLLLLMLLGPVLLPWYVTWALPLVWLLPRVARLVLLGTSTALALSQWTAEPARFSAAYDMNVLAGHYVITPIVVGLLGWLLLDAGRRWRGGLALHDEQGDSDAGRDERNDRGAPAARER